MRITAIVTILVLAIFFSFSSSAFAKGVDYVIGGSNWCYADARDAIIQSAEVTLKEERGKKTEIQGFYVTDIIKIVNGPKRKEYNKISFHVLVVDFDLAHEINGVTMVVYLVAAETDKGMYFSCDSAIVDPSNKKEYDEDLNDYVIGAEKYTFLNEMINDIKNNK